MEIQGKIIQLLQPQQINTQKGVMNKYGFILETNGQFAKKIHFQVFGDEKWNALNMANSLNVDANVFFDISSREWNGKWYTQCDAWKVVFVSQMVQQTQVMQQTQQVAQQTQVPSPQTANDTLPF